MTRAERTAIAGAALFAAGVPAITLGLWPQPAPLQSVTPPLLDPRAPPAVTAAYGRAIFAGRTVDDVAGDAPADAPALAGIVGRIGADAVALVRNRDGRTRSVAVGEGVDGWTLESLAIDAAYFTRGGQRARVPLPAGE